MQRTQVERARILVVDDSPVFGRFVADLLALTPDLARDASVGDAASALRMLDLVQPDAVVLGLHQPQSDSLVALGRVLACRPTPVLAISADNSIGADLSIEALRRGALDFIVHPNGPHLCDFRFRDELRARLRSLITCDLSAHLPRPIDRGLRATSSRAKAALQPSGAMEQPGRGVDQRIIVAGAGVGGPRALLRLFPQLRAPLPPMVIAQRIPGEFVAALARRLDTLSSIRCKVAETGDVLQPNTAYLAPADRQTVVVRQTGQPRLLVHSEEQTSATQPGPNADVLMQSAAMVYGSKCLGMLLTGNGRDGVQGSRAIGIAGGFVLGQDAASAYAHGTCRIASELGYIDRQFHLDDAADALLAVAPRLGQPAISVLRPPIIDPRPLHACAT